MTKNFTVKLKPEQNPVPSSYVVVTCPQCGKLTYGVAGQKGKKCPVCRHQFPMPAVQGVLCFKTPEEVCRFIQGEEAKRVGRMDFAPVTSGFRPAAYTPVIARTSKLITETKSLDAQFATWAHKYFLTVNGSSCTGVPTTSVIASAAKAGFMSPDKLIEKAIASGLLFHPRSYSVWLHMNQFPKK